MRDDAKLAKVILNNISDSTVKWHTEWFVRDNGLLIEQIIGPDVLKDLKTKGYVVGDVTATDVVNSLFLLVLDKKLVTRLYAECPVSHERIDIREGMLIAIDDGCVDVNRETFNLLCPHCNRDHHFPDSEVFIAFAVTEEYKQHLIGNLREEYSKQFREFITAKEKLNQHIQSLNKIKQTMTLYGVEIPEMPDVSI